MKNKLYLMVFMAMITSGLYAQIQRASQGVVHFEKKVNNYAILKEIYANDPQGPANFESYKQKNQQFEVYNYKLTFSSDKTLYQPSEVMIFKSPIGQTTANNIVFTDLSAERFNTQKKVLNKEYVIKDAIRKIKWKLTSETREIAGYQCKRANGVLMDSIYIVAFYTPDLLSNGGPELFSGLPGMILGVAVPDEHVTWFATKIELSPVEITESTVPISGTAYNISEFKAFLNKLDRLGPVKNKVITNALF